MDIFAWAENYNWNADYYDMYTGYTYHCSQVKETKDHIPVSENGILIGYVNRDKGL